jgi:hypothetical protein
MKEIVDQALEAHELIGEMDVALVAGAILRQDCAVYRPADLGRAHRLASVGRVCARLPKGIARRAGPAVQRRLITPIVRRSSDAGGSIGSCRIMSSRDGTIDGAVSRSASASCSIRYCRRGGSSLVASRRSISRRRSPISAQISRECTASICMFTPVLANMTRSATFKISTSQ